MSSLAGRRVASSTASSASLARSAPPRRSSRWPPPPLRRCGPRRKAWAAVTSRRCGLARMRAAAARCRPPTSRVSLRAGCGRWSWAGSRSHARSSVFDRIAAAEPVCYRASPQEVNPMNIKILASVVLGCVLNAACAQAPTRQLLVTANDNKVELRQGVVTVRPADNKDSLTIFDISSAPAKLVARVEAPASVVGPPQSVALAPDLSVAIMTAATRIDPADPAKTIDGNQISVIDLE